ncbi:MAG: 2-hydroxychromene-2-carboxylate isomerase [Myxococcales bacterium]
MSAQIDFYFDFLSPYSYLASMVLPRLAAEHGASISYRPFRLRELMGIVGNRPTTLECKNKGVYVMADLQRWAKSYQVQFSPNPDWAKIDFVELGRGALVAIDAGRGAAYVHAVFAALWSEPRDLSMRSVLRSTLDEAGFQSADLLDRAGSPEYVAKLDSLTSAAAERGLFGSPTMFIGDEMFFGNDRLEFLAQALRSAA